jgi:small subunit ribosomal protein S15
MRYWWLDAHTRPSQRARLGARTRQDPLARKRRADNGGGGIDERSAHFPRRPLLKNNSASYRNKENIDLSRVAGFQRSPTDTGSPEAQIARLSARVQQMSKHLIANRKDHGSKRGLERALAQRRSLMQYLYAKDRDTYDRLCVELGIRNVVKGHTVVQPQQ